MSSTRRRPRWLTRNVVVLSGVSLAQDAASEMIYPLLPILLTSVLGAPVALVGVIEGAAQGAVALTSYVAGRSSDRFGRKPLVATGYGLAAIGKVLVAGATGWGAVLTGRVVDRVGKGTRGAPRDALLADGVEHADMGKVFGLHRAADTLGAVVGPVLALAILGLTNDNIRIALWVAVVPAVASVALVAFARERSPRRRRGTESTAEPATGSSDTTRAATRRPRLPARTRTVAGLLAIVALVNFPDTLVLLRAYEVGLGPMGVVGAYILFNATYAAVSYPAGALADRWPRARVYALGLACFAVGYVGLRFAYEAWHVVVLLLIYGGFGGLTDGVGKAWISALTPATQRGHAQGLFQGLIGGATLVAGVWAGLLWQVGGGDGTVPLIVAGACAAVGSLSLLAAGRKLG